MSGFTKKYRYLCIFKWVKFTHTTILRPHKTMKIYTLPSPTKKIEFVIENFSPFNIFGKISYQNLEILKIFICT